MQGTTAEAIDIFEEQGLMTEDSSSSEDAKADTGTVSIFWWVDVPR